MTTLTLDERDHAFFKAVHDLMKNQYPEMEDKFGIWRIHEHFELNADELFHETSDHETKESTLRIVKKKDLPQEAFASTWKLTGTEPIVATWCCDHRPLIK